MRVPCPNCEAVYNIPEAMLAGGARRLRCARCATEWQVGAQEAPQPPPPVAAAALPPAAPPASTAAPAAPPGARTPRRGKPAAAKPDRPRGGVALGLAWAATFVVVAGLGAGFVVWPEEVTETFPPAARLYDALGIAVTESALSTSPAR